LLKEGLAGIPGVRIVTPMGRTMSAGVVVFDFPALDNNRIYEALYTEHGIAGSTKGGLRLCPHIYNTRADVERAVDAVRRTVT
jgi:selenocysteine lyase/cysteine desulfurase